MLSYAEKLISDVTSIKKSTHILPSSKTKVELDPSDMKWMSTFRGKLSNAANYLSPFRNVSKDDKCIVLDQGMIVLGRPQHTHMYAE